MAHHDLMSIAVETGSFRLAEMHTGHALSLYPHDHPRIPALAHDFAFALLRQHHYSAALYLLERVAQLIRRPEEQAIVLASLSWAAAGAGRMERLAEAERVALELVARFADYAPAVFLHLAEGWLAFGDVTRAEGYADAAMGAAAARQEPHLAREAVEFRNARLRRTEKHDDVPPGLRTRGVLRDLSARLRGWQQAPG